MKNFLPLVALVAVCGYFAAQFAGSIGFQVFTAINASNFVSVLTIAALGLLLMADYRQPRRRSSATACRLGVNTEMVAPTRRRTAYSIRRGAEAARLASPAAVIRFPSAPRLRCDRAA